MSRTCQVMNKLHNCIREWSKWYHWTRATTTVPDNSFRYVSPALLAWSYEVSRQARSYRGRSNTEPRPFPLFLAETFGVKYSFGDAR